MNKFIERSIWLRAWSHMTPHYTWESMTTRHDFGGVLGRPLDTFLWALTISWSWLLACVWSGPKCGVNNRQKFKYCSSDHEGRIGVFYNITDIHTHMWSWIPIAWMVEITSWPCSWDRGRSILAWVTPLVSPKLVTSISFTPCDTLLYWLCWLVHATIWDLLHSA